MLLLAAAPVALNGTRRIARECNRRFGLLGPGSTTSPTELPRPTLKWSCTSPGVAAGNIPRYRATAPATCGAAMEVPLIIPVALLSVQKAVQVDVMSTPGANTSRQVP